MQVHEVRVTGIGLGPNPVIFCAITVGGWRFLNCRIFRDRAGQSRVGFPDRPNPRPPHRRGERERDWTEMVHPLSREDRDAIDAQVVAQLDAAIQLFRETKPATRDVA